MLAARSAACSLLLRRSVTTNSTSSSLLVSGSQQLAAAPSRSHSHQHRAAFASSSGASSPAMDFEKVTFGGASGAYGYAAGPKDAKAAVVVLQEWWGVNDIIKQLALKVSEAGGAAAPFRVLVPDLYKGKVGVDAEEASHLMGALDFKAAVGELCEGVQYLRASGAATVGVTGFCMGGALSLAAAQHCGVDCAAPFYGIPDPAICDPAQIRVPVLLSFGRLDDMKGFSDPDSATALLQKMERSGAPASLHLYDGCGHAFMNALTPEGRAKIKAIGQADPPEDEVQAAFGRLTTFLKAHLLGA